MKKQINRLHPIDENMAVAVFGGMSCCCLGHMDSAAASEDTWMDLAIGSCANDCQSKCCGLESEQYGSAKGIEWIFTEAFLCGDDGGMSKASKAGNCITGTTSSYDAMPWGPY